MSLSSLEIKKEEEYLEEVKKLVGSKIKKLKEDNQDINDSITSEQKEMWKNVSDMDVSEIEFATSMREHQILQAKYYYQKLKKFERIYQSPYFGRIDFTDKEKRKVYIGLSSVSDKEYNHFVYDWRAPISSMYYDYELGEASYEAPEGIIEGYIDLKRQYKIENSNLEYAFDSTVSIQDEMLQNALSDNSSEKMKDIVTTIQKEQNEVIRNTKYDNLIVEGAAGSGKTSVALHRIAFILYKYRKHINKDNIIIFSPNKVFSEYISEVLPSLGEENVKDILFSEFLERQISEVEDIENYSQLIERFHNTKSKLEKDIMNIKMNNDFIKIVDNYIKRVVENIKFSDIKLGEEILITKKECETDFNETYSRFKPLIKVEKIINNVTAKYKNTHIKKIPGYSTKIRKQFNYPDNIFKVMENMYYDKDFLTEVSEKYHINTDDFQRFSLLELKSTSLKYYDGIIYLYLKAKLLGIDNVPYIKYVIIDEAQDYNLMQYYLIKEYYKNAKYTILGDPNQAITSMVDYKNMEEIKKIIGGKITLLKLLTTYRSSYEITNYCNKILDLDYVNMVNRHSEKPKEICINKEDLKPAIVNLIKQGIKENMSSVAVLCENKEKNLKLEELLRDVKLNIKLYILPVYNAKGLEFDSVIVYDDGFSVYDKKLYYVASTRALHKLNILKLANR